LYITAESKSLVISNTTKTFLTDFLQLISYDD